MSITSIITLDGERLWQDFVTDLCVKHIEAGKPSYRQLAERSEKLARATDKTISFSKTTVSRVLTRRAEPRWDFVVAFLRSLEVPNETIIKVWHPKWTTLMTTLHGVVPAVVQAAEPPLAGTICPRCGSWVADQELHEAWHTTIGATRLAEPAPRRLHAVKNTAAHYVGLTG